MYFIANFLQMFSSSRNLRKIIYFLNDQVFRNIKYSSLSPISFDTEIYIDLTLPINICNNQQHYFYYFLGFFKLTIQ